MECKARLRGLWRIIYSKTIISGLLSARTGRRVRHGRREQASRRYVFAVDSFLRLIILCSDVAPHVRNFHRVQYYNNCMVCGER